MTDDASRVRADKWLWAARFYKTRSLATEAIAGGKVHVNGERVKPAKPLQVGDELRIRQGPYEFQIMVRELADRRGPAARAAALYEETAASRETRERLAHELKAMHSLMHAASDPHQRSRPTKRDRRAMERFRERRD
jgi:ribosome-associated heat shock protein Hsp15